MKESQGQAENRLRSTVCGRSLQTSWHGKTMLLVGGQDFYQPVQVDLMKSCAHKVQWINDVVFVRTFRIGIPPLDEESIHMNCVDFQSRRICTIHWDREFEPPLNYVSVQEDGRSFAAF